MLKKVMSVILLAILVLCAGCGCDTVNSQEPQSEQTRTLVEMLRGSDVTASDEMITAFFNYFERPWRDSEHPYFNHEPRLLPNTDTDGQPEWNGLTLFVFDYCVAEGITSVEKDYLITTSQFDAVAERFFPKAKYTHASSDYLILSKDGYTPLGFDVHGAYYYRLTEIKQTGRVYTASFEGFCIYESDFPLDITDDGLSRNGVAVLNKAGLDYLDDNAQIEQTMLEIFLSDDCLDVLRLDERLTVSFELTGDADYPFAYISCARESLRGY